MGKDTVTIEKTSKKLKIRLIISWLLFLFGLFVGVPLFSVLMSGGNYTTGKIIIGSIFALPLPAGILLYIVTRAQIWWDHG